MDPAIRIRIHTKMSWILNTGVYFTTCIHYQVCILHFLKKDKNRCILENSYLVKPVQLIKRGLRDMYMPRKKYVKSLITEISPFLHFWRLHCKQVPIYVFLEKKTARPRSNFHIHATVSDLCIPTIAPPAK